ncbi:MAG: methyltransferase domain-containing protein [Planctomycetia bacterium]|nr:methyltransferase domain-containing protein [Planctomycetia bacterium]
MAERTVADRNAADAAETDDSSAPPPSWRLPVGISRGVWEYAHRPQVAGNYDEEFAENTLFDFDESVLLRHFTKPGTFVDLGCGTGRALLPFARRGFQAVGVDLSPRFLRLVAEKATRESLSIELVVANLIELGCLADASVDYAACLFSTLGMIRGRASRAQALAHVYRSLKPGGIFIVHVHNRWHNLRESQGRRWLLKNLTWERWRGTNEPGDKYFPYRGIREMFLHLFTKPEFERDLREPGFEIVELIPLDTAKRHALPHPWLFGRLRANGWIAVCRKP